MVILIYKIIFTNIKKHLYRNLAGEANNTIGCGGLYRKPKLKEKLQ